jgi:hypothetical protein
VPSLQTSHPVVKTIRKEVKGVEETFEKIELVEREILDYFKEACAKKEDMNGIMYMI